MERLRALTAAALLLVPLSLTACTSDSGTADAAAAATPPAATATNPVIVPGRPGEDASTLPADQVSPEPPRVTTADVEYIEMMIPHHEQALEMASLAADRTENADVTAMAERIIASQGPEVETMRAWLEQNAPAGDGHAHEDAGHEDAGHDSAPPHSGHADMPGMATPEQLARLADSTGEEFDALFVELMSTHHQGAVTMATDVLVRGAHFQVEEMAQEVIAIQSVEIDRMRDMVAR
ncbi:DUF305 domain-containing protein [Allostreptomyces psammosilenae]|uniref:Uncharacterized protein (DUF305 family) n=1 Tax=Allostreptomyces psammosilenae TaxID=1892865 RepID=A0A853A232_9ACTN|nr:DUF305 domain-containing protein [Allostreptomyces psammosilenae]NYI04831.1 uncharacterized protein (DUF305 family) [Allostreptomyces psammosilenae]